MVILHKDKIMSELLPNLEIETLKRLSIVSSKIFKKKEETAVLGSLGQEKPNLASYLDLIYLLIEGDSKLAKSFWEAFVNAQAFCIELNHVFDIKQLSRLLDLVKENKEKEGTDESAELFESLKEFISINGLVHKASEDHIQFKEALQISGGAKINRGAIAEIKIEEKFKNKVITKYKQLLLESILVIHGITPSIYQNYNFNSAKKPEVGIKNVLSRNNLIRDFDITVSEEKEYIDNYLRRYDSTYEKIVARYEVDPDDPESSMGVEFDYLQKTTHTLKNYWLQAWTIANELNLFKGLLEDFNKESLKTRPKFEYFLALAMNNLDYEIPILDPLEERPTFLSDLNKTIKSSLDKLIQILDARANLEDQQESYERYVTGPYFGDDRRADWEPTFDYDEVTGERTNYESPVAADHNIPIKSLALIAMLKESRSINNELMKEDGTLIYGDEKDSVTIVSARKWLTDPKRKYPFYKLIDIDKLTPQKITLNTLRTINTINEA